MIWEDNIVDSRLIEMVLTGEEQQEMVTITKEFYNALQKKARMEAMIYSKLKPIAIGDLKKIVLSYDRCTGMVVNYIT